MEWAPPGEQPRREPTTARAGWYTVEGRLGERPLRVLPTSEM